jgi:hypothetical protein
MFGAFFCDGIIVACRPLADNYRSFKPRERRALLTLLFPHSRVGTRYTKKSRFSLRLRGESF